MLIIANINVNNLDLDSVIQCLYLINNLQESLNKPILSLLLLKCRSVWVRRLIPYPFMKLKTGFVI